MNVKLTIFKKPGAVSAMFYSQDCNAAKSHLESLPQKGYEIANDIPISVQSGAPNSELKISLQAEGDVEIKPTSKTLLIQHVKPDSPAPVNFTCSSASGAEISVELVITQDGNEVEREIFDVECKKTKAKDAAGNALRGNTTAQFLAENEGVMNIRQQGVTNEQRIGKSQDSHGSATAAFVSGGQFQNFSADGANIDVTAKQKNYVGDVNYTKNQPHIAPNISGNRGQVHFGDGGDHTQNTGQK